MDCHNGLPESGAPGSTIAAPLQESLLVLSTLITGSLKFCHRVAGRPRNLSGRSNDG
jgi:hypothetical protein